MPTATAYCVLCGGSVRSHRDLCDPCKSDHTVTAATLPIVPPVDQARFIRPPASLDDMCLMTPMTQRQQFEFQGEMESLKEGRQGNIVAHRITRRT